MGVPDSQGWRVTFSSVLLLMTLSLKLQQLGSEIIEQKDREVFEPKEGVGKIQEQ
jgi:hypothetical protein